MTNTAGLEIPHRSCGGGGCGSCPFAKRCNQDLMSLTTMFRDRDFVEKYNKDSLNSSEPPLGAISTNGRNPYIKHQLVKQNPEGDSPLVPKIGHKHEPYTTSGEELGKSGNRHEASLPGHEPETKPESNLGIEAAFERLKSKENNPDKKPLSSRVSSCPVLSGLLLRRSQNDVVNSLEKYAKEHGNRELNPVAHDRVETQRTETKVAAKPETDNLVDRQNPNKDQNFPLDAKVVNPNQEKPQTVQITRPPDKTPSSSYVKTGDYITKDNGLKTSNVKPEDLKKQERSLTIKEGTGTRVEQVKFRQNLGPGPFPPIFGFTGVNETEALKNVPNQQTVNSKIQPNPGTATQNNGVPVNEEDTRTRVEQFKFRQSSGNDTVVNQTGLTKNVPNQQTLNPKIQPNPGTATQNNGAPVNVTSISGLNFSTLKRPASIANNINQNSPSNPNPLKREPLTKLGIQQNRQSIKPKNTTKYLPKLMEGSGTKDPLISKSLGNTSSKLASVNISRLNLNHDKLPLKTSVKFRKVPTSRMTPPAQPRIGNKTSPKGLPRNRNQPRLPNPNALKNRLTRPTNSVLSKLSNRIKDRLNMRRQPLFLLRAGVKGLLLKNNQPKLENPFKFKHNLPNPLNRVPAKNNLNLISRVNSLASKIVNQIKIKFNKQPSRSNIPKKIFSSSVKYQPKQLRPASLPNRFTSELVISLSKLNNRSLTEKNRLLLRKLVEVPNRLKQTVLNSKAHLEFKQLVPNNLRVVLGKKPLQIQRTLGRTLKRTLPRVQFIKPVKGTEFTRVTNRSSPEVSTQEIARLIEKALKVTLNNSNLRNGNFLKNLLKTVNEVRKVLSSRGLTIRLASPVKSDNIFIIFMYFLFSAKEANERELREKLRKFFKESPYTVLKSLKVLLILFRRFLLTTNVRNKGELISKFKQWLRKLQKASGELSKRLEAPEKSKQLGKTETKENTITGTLDLNIAKTS